MKEDYGGKTREQETEDSVFALALGCAFGFVVVTTIVAVCTGLWLTGHLFTIAP